MATYNSMIEGLHILAKYEKKGLETSLAGAEHDILYSGTETSTKISDEDKKQLSGLGWHQDHSSGVWSRFC